MPELSFEQDVLPYITL